MSEEPATETLDAPPADNGVADQIAQMMGGVEASIVDETKVVETKNEVEESEDIVPLEDLSPEEAVETKDKADPLEEANAKIESLRQQIEALAAKVPVDPPKAVDPPQDEYTPTVSDEEFETAMNSTEGFNKVAQKIEARAIDRVVTGLPKVLNTIIPQMVEQRLQIELFFHDNKELRPHRNYMKTIAEELLQKDPEIAKDVNTMLVATATELKQRLALGERTNGSTVKAPPRNPRTPSAKPAPSANEPKNNVERQLREMMGIQ